MLYKLLVIVGSPLVIGACALPGVGAGAVGAGLGAAGGAAAGSQVGAGAGQVAATAAGMAAGALAGHQIAESLAEEDLRQANDAEYRAIEAGEPITWTNPQTGIRGVVEPQRTYEGASGQVCREFSHIIYMEGRAETVTGTACRQPDRTWRLLRQSEAEQEAERP